MESEATGSPLDLDALFAQISDDCTMEDFLRLDESAGHTTPDPQSAGDTSHAIAGLRQAVLYPVGVGLAGPTAATGAENLAENQHEQNAHPSFDWTGTSPGCLTQPATYPGPLAGTGTEEIPHSWSAPPLGFNMREVNAALTPTAAVKDNILSVEHHPREHTTTPLVVNAGLAMPEPYSATGDSSCRSTTTADMGSSSLDLEVYAGAGLPHHPQSGGGALPDAPVRASFKRKKPDRGSYSQRSTPELNLVESLEVGLVQSDDTSPADIKPSTSTDLKNVRFLKSESSKLESFCGPHNSLLRWGKEVNRSLGEQDQTAPVAARSYVTTAHMVAYEKTRLGYWKEKEVKAVRNDELVDGGPILSLMSYEGIRKTFQFHDYDGNKTNWFIHEYIPTNCWGIDLFMGPLRFRVVGFDYKGAEVPGEPTSPEVKIKNKIAAAKKHRMRGPDDPKVVKGESPAWQHFIKIYDRHPELDGSKVVYAVCCYCEGVLKAGSGNGTNSLSTHCNRTCPRKHLQPSSS